MAEKDVAFYNPHAGLFGRDGGPYLDDVERENAEIRRAKGEGREPDLENATFTTGTPATTGAVLLQVPTEISNVSLAARDEPLEEMDVVEPMEKLTVDTTSPVEFATAQGESANVATSDPNLGEAVTDGKLDANPASGPDSVNVAADKKAATSSKSSDKS